MIGKLKVLLACVVFGLALAAHPLGADVRITAIDVGQGDSTLIQHQDYNVLIDGGWDFDEVADNLREVGVSSLDMVIGTHGHADHIGGLVGVLERKNVDTIVYNGQTHTTDTFERFVDAVQGSGARYHEPSPGEVIELGEMEVQFLHPEGSAAHYEGHLHDMNIVTRITYGEFAAIISGDIEQEGELDILQSGLDVSAQVLELGHHGSHTSTHPDWVEAVDPELAYWQAGEDNQYGHPHDEPLQILDRHGVNEVLGTATHGNIIITGYQDGSFEYSTEKEPGGPGEPSVSEEDCIDLNEADRSELEEIVHIGTARAEAIKMGRPWESVDDLDRIHGMGNGRISDIESQGMVCQ